MLSAFLLPVLRYVEMKRKRKRLINPDTLVLLRQIGIGLAVFAGVALIITAIWHGTRIQALTIQEVEVKGGETIDHEQLKKIVHAGLEGQYLKLIPKTFAWFYPADKIREDLSQVDRIYNVKLSVEGGRKIIVTFDEYTPFALWCNSGDEDNCVFINKEGYAFAQAPTLSGGSFLRFSNIGKQTELLTNFTDGKSLADLLQLKTLLEEKGWYANQFELDNEGDAYVSLSPSSELKISLDQTPGQTIDNLFTVLASEDFVDLTPGNFQYIDLRYGNKVFVKEHEVIDESATSTEEVAE